VYDSISINKKKTSDQPVTLRPSCFGLCPSGWIYKKKRAQKEIKKKKVKNKIKYDFQSDTTQRAAPPFPFSATSFSDWSRV
jgi:hypothetical protein